MLAVNRTDRLWSDQETSVCRPWSYSQLVDCTKTAFAFDGQKRGYDERQLISIIQKKQQQQQKDEHLILVCRKQ